MADYSDELADKIYAQVAELDPNQRRVWKTRNKIPDRYLKEGFTFRPRVKQIVRVENIRQDRLAQVFNSEKLNKTLLWQVADMPGKELSSHAKDFVKGTVHLHEDERKRLVNTIQQLRVKIKNALGEGAEELTIARRKSLLAVARDPLIKKVPMFGQLGRRLAPSNDQKTFDEYSREEYSQMIDSLSVFLLESSL